MEILRVIFLRPLKWFFFRVVLELSVWVTLAVAIVAPLAISRAIDPTFIQRHPFVMGAIVIASVVFFEFVLISILQAITEWSRPKPHGVGQIVIRGDGLKKGDSNV
jgi:hypothetical protein